MISGEITFVSFSYLPDQKNIPLCLVTSFMQQQILMVTIEMHILRIAIKQLWLIEDRKMNCYL